MIKEHLQPFISFTNFSEFSDALAKKKCPTCKASFDTEMKLMMHIGATHREVGLYKEMILDKFIILSCQLLQHLCFKVQKYLPEHAKANLKAGIRSPAKSKTPLRGPTPDPSQKFLANLMKGQKGQVTEVGKKNSPKSGSPKSAAATELPQLADEFMS